MQNRIFERSTLVNALSDVDLKPSLAADAEAMCTEERGVHELAQARRAVSTARTILDRFSAFPRSLHFCVVRNALELCEQLVH